MRAGPEDEVRQAVLKEGKLERVLKWVVARYQWERSDKNKLEAILEMMVWSRDGGMGATEL